MPKFKDISGQVYGRLTVIRRVTINDKPRTYWDCTCSCGKTVVVWGDSLRRGATRSCGCFMRERAVETNTTHGLRNHPLYFVWNGMRDRCYKETHPRYKDWGGRGVKFCDRWLNFKNFYDDMSPTYQKGLTIDRIDNDGDYSPDNCRWATHKEQANNQRSNRVLEFNGKNQTLAQWSEELNINYDALRDRLNEEWSVEDALTTPVIKNTRVITFEGKTKNITEWANGLNIHYMTLHGRLKRGWSVKKTLTTPIRVQ